MIHQCVELIKMADNQMKDETSSTLKSKISDIRAVSRAENAHQPLEDTKTWEEPESDIPETQNSKQENICPQDDHENEGTEAQVRELNDPGPDSDLPCQELLTLDAENDQEKRDEQVNAIVTSPQIEVILSKIRNTL